MVDPRASLVDRMGGGKAVAGLLNKMDSVEVLVQIAPSSTSLGLSIVNLCARLFPNVSVANDFVAEDPLFGRGSIKDLSSRIVETARVSIPKRPEKTVSIGVGTTARGLDLYCSSGIWNVRLSRQPHAPLDGVGPALVAASAIASAQISRDILPELGGVQLEDEWKWNVLNYALACVDDEPPPSLVDFILFGAGSVGSSLIYSLLLSKAKGEVTVVDPDRLVSRNKLRYPLWLEEPADNKVEWIFKLCTDSGLNINPVPSRVADFVSSMQSSPALVVSAVDNVTARRDTVDALSRTTIDSGVDGLQLHVSRHRFGDGLACGYCDYVDAGEFLDQVGVYSSMTGLAPARVLALLSGETLAPEDIKVIRQKAAIEESLNDYVGLRLADLVRARLYAQARSKIGDSVVAVSAPYVSALVGAVLASEVQKQSPDLSKFKLDRRIDIDCSGYPTGILSRPSQDKTGRCLCADNFRVSEYRSQWGEDPGVA